MDVTFYHKVLFEHFGFNFGFATDQLEKYFEDRNSVTEYWQNYFDDLTSNQKKSDSKASAVSPIQISNAPKLSPSFEVSSEDELKTIVGVGAKIIENMTNSLSIPTATSLRTISVKLLEENRRVINQHLKKVAKGKLSFTHIIAYAVVQAAKKIESMNNSFAIVDGKPTLVKKPYVNLGIAVDVEKKDGTRSLIVPNIKKAESMNFEQFFSAYNSVVEKAKSGKLEPIDFQGSTITLTNPGGIGTVSSTPRLMNGQGVIIAIGSIDYPAEFKAMDASALAQLGIGKTMNVTSTYDHRIIQGAESGEFLSYVNSLLLGEENFYTKIFIDLAVPQKSIGWDIDTTSRSNSYPNESEHIKKQALLLQLINMFRVRGHLIADLNPLGQKYVYQQELDPSFYGFTIWDYDRPFITGNIQGLERGTLRQILDMLHNTYCERIGVEYMHIQNPDEKLWLQKKMEPIVNKPSYSADLKKRIMEKLIVAEAFEHFLHTKFIGHKRFSLEGSETVIPVLDYLLGLASDEGVKEALLGMAHRGRLNVLTNIIGKNYEKIFNEFEEDLDPDSPQGTGDVKYHLGATGYYNTFNNKGIKVSVASNPSHLEFVNPVVEGITRAKQIRDNDSQRNKYLPILMHGDAAFAGQGIVAETLNFSQLKGYRTGGTIHIIINNQIGFTTNPEDARSSPYATDVAKMVQSPIFHVNGDDPESALWVAELAYQYRQRFNKDVVIDIIGYRRHGHNEGDDPVYTQPLMYKKIKAHPSVKQIYEQKIQKEKIMNSAEIETLDKNVYGKLNEALASKKKKDKFVPDRLFAYPVEEYEKGLYKKETKVDFETIKQIVNGITEFPPNFDVNQKLKKSIEKRKELIEGDGKADWAFGEALAFGSLLLEGKFIRLSGQDSARGTFSQRHLVFTDMNNEEEILPLNNISPNQAKIEALDSLLSENAVLGFEFGYSVADPLALVIWEAQFGDFANGAQVIIDNFIAASYTKWQLPNSLVMLLPHGQEGQGPEHSSARIERFLTLCAEDNMQVCYPTTPAQYFHLLRRQVHSHVEKPLIIFTPKSLLRNPAAKSSLEEFTNNSFQEIIDDNTIADKNLVKKVLLTSGKIYYELLNHQQTNNITDTAIVRVEQYYPYNSNRMKELLASFRNAKTLCWVQEEPRNMGAWNFLWHRLMDDKTEDMKLQYVGRAESPSPASGSQKKYLKSQEEIIKSAFS